MKTFYDILGVDRDAIDKEIINAYSKLINRNTKEKNFQKHNIIVKAYNILINEKTRQEYDTILDYGDKIKKYEMNANNYINDNNYKKAIKEYETILSIYTSSSYYLYKLVKALERNEELEKAINKCKVLVNNNKNIKEYNELMASLYKKNKQYEESIRYYINTYKLSTDKSIAIEIINIYKLLRRHEDAIMFLQENIRKNRLDIFNDMIYYEEIIKLYAENKNDISIKYTIDNMKNIIIDSSTNKEDDIIKFCEVLYELAQGLYIDKLVEGADAIIHKLKLILEEINLQIYLKINNKFKIYEEVCRFYDKMKLIINLNNEYKCLEKDNDIIRNIKVVAKYSLFKIKYENKEKIDFKLKESIDNLHRELEISPNQVMKNLNIFKNKYKKLFKHEEEIYSRLLSHAKDLDDFNDQYESYKNDIDNNKSLDQIIESMLDDSINNNERIRIINLSLRKIRSSDYEKKQNTYKFIIHMKNTYPKVYELYKKGFDKLLEDLKPSRYEYIKYKISRFILILKS